MRGKYLTKFRAVVLAALVLPGVVTLLSSASTQGSVKSWWCDVQFIGRSIVHGVGGGHSATIHTSTITAVMDTTSFRVQRLL
jgi:hypothetical protein